MLHNQLIIALKEHQVSTWSKGKEVSDPSIPNSTAGSSSHTRDKLEPGIMSLVPINRAQEQNNHAVNKTLKLDFPKFSGKNSRIWLRKCLRYFSYNPMSDYHKLSLISMNLEGFSSSIMLKIGRTKLGKSSPNWY